MTRPLRTLIDLNALDYNLQHIKKFTKNRQIMAMVKANGYGHDIKLVTQGLKHADNFGVACLEEAMELRKAGITKPITLMEGLFINEDLDTAHDLNLDLVIHNNWQIGFLKKYLNKPLKIWLKINTGMNRLGFTPEDFQRNFILLKEQKNIHILGFMTHFADASNLNSLKTQQQLDLFKDSISALPEEYLLSTANSAAILKWPETWGDVVRPGILLYGISPFNNSTGRMHGLKPVMTLETKIIAIHLVKQGEAVGYDSRYVCAKDSRIGIIAIGYGDGYPRNAPDGTPVLVNEKRAGIVGNVSMDMMAIDLTNHEDAKIGDRVVLWGEDLPIEEVAAAIGTISYELITSLTPRVTRVVCNS